MTTAGYKITCVSLMEDDHERDLWSLAIEIGADVMTDEMAASTFGTAGVICECCDFSSNTLTEIDHSCRRWDFSGCSGSMCDELAKFVKLTHFTEVDILNIILDNGNLMCDLLSRVTTILSDYEIGEIQVRDADKHVPFGHKFACLTVVLSCDGERECGMPHKLVDQCIMNKLCIRRNGFEMCHQCRDAVGKFVGTLVLC